MDNENNHPDKLQDVEFPREGYSPAAGFTVIVGGKNAGAKN